MKIQSLANDSKQLIECVEQTSKLGSPQRVLFPIGRSKLISINENAAFQFELRRRIEFGTLIKTKNRSVENSQTKSDCFLLLKK